MEEQLDTTQEPVEEQLNETSTIEEVELQDTRAVSRGLTALILILLMGAIVVNFLLNG